MNEPRARASRGKMRGRRGRDTCSNGPSPGWPRAAAAPRAARGGPAGASSAGAPRRRDRAAALAAWRRSAGRERTDAYGSALSGARPSPGGKGPTRPRGRRAKVGRWARQIAAGSPSRRLVQRVSAPRRRPRAPPEAAPRRTRRRRITFSPRALARRRGPGGEPPRGRVSRARAAPRRPSAAPGARVGPPVRRAARRGDRHQEKRRADHIVSAGFQGEPADAEEKHPGLPPEPHPLRRRPAFGHKVRSTEYGK